MSSHSFEQTYLWKNSLAPQRSDEATENARSRLATTFHSFRTRVAMLAAEIHRDLPEYTVHDITHLDALWEMADIISGSDYSLTPTEAFVFGGAVFLHDLGMALASYPQGLDELRREPSWSDIVTNLFDREFGRFPTAKELEEPPDNIKKEAIGNLLRNLHARQAERLASVSWKANDDAPPQYLIEDNEIRQTFGRTIGLIAHSHWWPIERIETEFQRTLGAPHWCPNDWIIDPLKIACLLRVADAAHIDARRAPSFLRALRRPSQYSDEHWKFQEKLQKPHLAEDSLAYTSGFAFPLRDAPSWWLCLDTLALIDRELRHVDALLADKGLPRFAARRVAGVDSPERLVAYIPTDGWLPVNAFIQVSDVPTLVNNLGGSELYGKDPSVPIRELIQNSADAIRARRFIEQRTPTWGTITIRLGRDDTGNWLEVHDNGIGMSKEVLTKYLLDFGSSYWGSNLMIDEFPGLLASGVQLTGKYGIGFFSVFMLGSAIRIATRRADAAQRDTLILEFNTGVSARPILRNANEVERIREGGTTIRIWLTTPPNSSGGLLSFRGDKSRTLMQLCRHVCPALDVELLVDDGDVQTKIESNEWLHSSTEDFVRNFISALDWPFDEAEKELEKTIEKLSQNIREIRNPTGETVGRATISSERFLVNGAVTVGGLHSCRLSGIFGILTGLPERAARDYAKPKVLGASLSAWASDQAALIAGTVEDHREQFSCATIVRRCGGDVAGLAIAKFRGRWVTQQDLSEVTDLPSELLLVEPTDLNHVEKLRGYQVLPNVVAVSSSSWMNIIQSTAYSEWPEEVFESEGQRRFHIRSTLGGVVIEAASKAWGVDAERVYEAYLAKENTVKQEVICHVNDEDIKAYVRILRKPLHS